jgi:hypothetical protein
MDINSFKIGSVTMTTATAFRAKTCQPSLLTSPFSLNSYTAVLPDQDLILVHTNITIPLLDRIAFHYDNHLVVKQLLELQNRDSGLVGHSLRAHLWQGNYQTITVWRDTKALASFYARGHHGDTMKRWKSSIKMGETALTDRYIVKLNDLPEKESDLQEFWRRVGNQEFPVWKRPNLK